MINYIWAFMILVSIICGVINGNIDSVVQAAFDGANGAVQIVIGFVGITAMWNGLMNIAHKSDLIKLFAYFIRPINKIIFPSVKKDREAMEAISANMVANILGLSNAATPLGIKAMQHLDGLNGSKATASDAMCMFAIINSASIQIIPSTLIGIRASMGSGAPSEIIVPVWIVSFLTAFICIVFAKICSSVSFVGRPR